MALGRATPAFSQSADDNDKDSRDSILDLPSWVEHYQFVGEDSQPPSPREGAHPAQPAQDNGLDRMTMWIRSVESALTAFALSVCFI